MAKGGVDRAVVDQGADSGPWRRHSPARRHDLDERPERQEHGRAEPRTVDCLARRTRSPAIRASRHTRPRHRRIEEPRSTGQPTRGIADRALSARAGSEQAKGIAKELARIAKDNLPSTLTGKLLSRVASAGDIRDIGRGIQRVSEILAQHNVKSALGDMQDLIGKGELSIFTRPGAPRATQAKSPHVVGDVNPATLKQVNLSDLSLDTRHEIRPLIEQAKLLKAQLERATVPDETIGARRLHPGPDRRHGQAPGHREPDPRPCRQRSFAT